MQIIQLDEVYKDYDTDGRSVPALRGVSLDVDAGEFSALAGPSGSGKTTLLNIIGGLDQPTSGIVRVESTVLNDLPAKKLADMRLRRIGFVFQAYNLIPVLTAFENVEYVPLLQGMGKPERTKRTEEVLCDVGLQEEMHRPPHELSGGQQQRVAIARAIVSEPTIVLADEPTANLDQRTGGQLLDMMGMLNQEKGITFLFSTHDPMVMKRSQRLISMVDGKIA